MEKNETTVKEKKSFKQWLSDHKPTKRRIIQLYAALLTNANLKGFASGYIYKGAVKNGCAPGLNCYSCPAASAACPLGALQNALASSNARIPYYMFGILLLYCILFGRWICGFLCPFGLIQDLVHKIKTPKIKKNRVTRILSYFKYVILVVFVGIIPVIYAFQSASLPVPAFCKYICPSGVLIGAFGLLSNEVNSDMFQMLGPLFTWKFVLLVIFLVGAIFIYRFFCRFFCPLGALYGLFNKISILGIKLDKPKCVDCGLCVGKCEMDIRHVGDHECISCGNCVNVCPTGAISYKGPKILLAPNEVGGKINTAKLKTCDPCDAPGTELPKKTKIARLVVAISMFAVLAGALVYYNFIDKDPVIPEVTVPSGDSTVNYGGDVGDVCYDYELDLIYEEGSTSAKDYRGKVTVINFWGTWCGPCKQELLTEFPLIDENYGDQVVVLTVHSNLGWAKKTPDNIKELFPDSAYLFVKDGKNEDFFKMLGGRDSWPMTVILDEDGVIVKTFVGSVKYDDPQSETEDLKGVIDSILAK
jgi:ferredoxin